MTDSKRTSSAPKGILKTPSVDQHEPEEQRRKSMKWDEMNILATYHPPDKDYGHMKIDDPPTPYHRDRKSESDPDDDIDPEQLASRLETASEKKPKAMAPSGDDESSEEDEKETAEERAKRKAFEMKRKLHYNEYQAVKLARQLMQSGDEDEEEEDEDSPPNPQNHPTSGSDS